MVQSTHDVILGETEVVKRYRSWDRGEPEREWRALTLLHQHCPGLAPEPLTLRSENGTPVIVMSRVPGVPLGGSPLTSTQVAGVAQAMRTLHDALPEALLETLEERRSGRREMITELTSWSREPHEPVSLRVEAALDAAATWLDCYNSPDLTGASHDQVFTLADGNLGNFLWDGERCRLVDFEDSGASETTYEVADVVEHVSAWLLGVLDADQLADSFGVRPEQRSRLLDCRRLLAMFWLVMLLPGNPGHARNPPGSLERQAQRMHDLLLNQ